MRGHGTGAAGPGEVDRRGGFDRLSLRKVGGDRAQALLTPAQREPVEGRVGIARHLIRLGIPLLLLPACHLQPVYAGGGSGATATLLRSVDVDPIPDRAGFLLHAALTDRLGGARDGAAAYRLQVELDDSIIGIGTRPDDSVSRERRTLRARYRLVDDRGQVLLDQTTGSDAGVEVVGSEYAIIAAEDTAMQDLVRVVADQIVSRLARFQPTP